MTLPKQWRLISVATAVLVALGGCATSSDAPDTTASTIIDEPGIPKQLQARQIIVALPERLRMEWPTIARDLQTQYRLRPVGEFPLTSIKVQCFVFQVPSDQPLETVIGQLSADPRVELAQPNQHFEGLQSAANPYRDLAYGAKMIRADRAHAVSTGRSVSIAVIDTGADTEHPDLQGRIAETATFVEGGEPSFRSDRHGTAVAGLIGARNNSAGVEGIAPDSRLTVLKSCWYSDPDAAKARCSSWTLAKAVDYAINHQIRVLNLSLGGRPDDLLARLLTTAEQRGIVVVVAAREQADEPGFPASLNTVIPVVACDMKGAVVRPQWSAIPFAAVAPGVDVVAPAPQGRYTLLSGSSLAAAHVSGVVALLLQQMPQATPAQIRTVLQATAKPLSETRSANQPQIRLIDACAALARSNPSLTCP